jgi:hypothetical protein
MKFTAYGESGKPALLDRQPGDDYFDWVSFDRPTFEAPPNVWQTVRMTIKAPKDAAFGYYYAAVFTPAKGKPTGKGNVVIGSSAVLVLLEVESPNARKTLEVTSFSSDRRAYEFLPAGFTIRFRNKGNVHVIPHGTVYVEKGGRQIARLIFNAQQGNVLPGTNRIYKTAWDAGFPHYAAKTQSGKIVVGKDGLPDKSLNWDFSKAGQFRLGRYTAHLVAIYDDGTKDVPLDARVTFWVIPWRIIAVLLIILAIVAFGLWTAVRPAYRRIRKGGHGGKRDA